MIRVPQTLEMQTIALRQALGLGHTYDFIDGGVDHPMEPGIAHLTAPDDTFHAYFEPTSGRSMVDALDDLEMLVSEADPPYDAILGFSQGSTLAATMMTRPDCDYVVSPFKFAVFFSAGMAADHAALFHDKVCMLESLPRNRRISIPTAHIYDENDPLSPRQGHLLRALCQDTGLHAATHGLGHQIPGRNDKKDLDAAVAAIKRVIADAGGNQRNRPK
ncbi:hypothetical protein QQS21_001465 [Conoideocrella luteorostrata]|uniref:Serine hydrolase domain-containing protein n=1 Tax=Conoideocrella luteorostrata TaxID=1105319 RepID=A0AAJ0CWZ6_9HYPO|nr:hypothetical protein QQS21_001465 [Conoideocrella luteorostrata]